MFQPRPRAVLVDVGFTITFHDGPRIASLAAEGGVQVTAESVHGAERALRRELAHYRWPSRAESPAPVGDGIRFCRRLLELAGAQAAAPQLLAARGPAAAQATWSDFHHGLLDAAAERVWRSHLQRNVWSRVGAGVADALARLRGAGIRLAVVSNSEGTIERMLAEVGLLSCFDTVVDSWVVGLAKPDPRIFELALRHLDVPPHDAVHVGDSPAADVAGARSAGVRAALVDPFDFHEACDAPRFRDFAAFADAVLQK